MQVSVSSKKRKKFDKSKIKSVVSTILVFLFAIISTAILISHRKKSLAFDSKYFYFISVASANKESLLENKKELVKNLGGANVVYKQDGNYHLLVNVYLDFQSAEEIRQSLLGYFPDAKILKIKTTKITKTKVKKIRKHLENEKLIRFLYNLVGDFEELEMSYLSGEISDGEIIKYMLKYKLELEKINDSIAFDDEISIKCLEFGELINLHLTNFLSGFDISKSKQNYVCNYFVGFYLNYIEMFNSL